MSAPQLPLLLYEGVRVGEIIWKVTWQSSVVKAQNRNIIPKPYFQPVMVFYGLFDNDSTLFSELELK